MRQYLKRAKLLLPTCYNSLDELAQRSISAGGHKVSCQRGCAWCCNQMVVISLLEGLWLADQVVNMPSGIRRKVINRLRATAAGPHTTPEEHFTKSHVCGFLDRKTKDCRVYARRPAACRLHFVISPPERCHPKTSQRTQLLDTSEQNAQALDLSHRCTDQIFAGPMPNTVLYCVREVEPSLRVTNGIVDPFDWLNNQLCRRLGGAASLGTTEAPADTGYNGL